jgi:hypothetical protein
MRLLQTRGKKPVVDDIDDLLLDEDTSVIIEGKT